MKIGLQETDWMLVFSQVNDPPFFEGGRVRISRPPGTVSLYSVPLHDMRSDSVWQFQDTGILSRNGCTAHLRPLAKGRIPCSGNLYNAGLPQAAVAFREKPKSFSHKLQKSTTF